jgi:hypothetical protein
MALLSQKKTCAARPIFLLAFQRESLEHGRSFRDWRGMTTNVFLVPAGPVRWIRLLNMSSLHFCLYFPVLFTKDLWVLWILFCVKLLVGFDGYLEPDSIIVFDFSQFVWLNVYAYEIVLKYVNFLLSLYIYGEKNLTRNHLVINSLVHITYFHLCPTRPCYINCYYLSLKKAVKNCAHRNEASNSNISYQTKQIHPHHSSWFCLRLKALHISYQTKHTPTPFFMLLFEGWNLALRICKVPSTSSVTAIYRESKTRAGKPWIFMHCNTPSPISPVSVCAHE